MLPALAVHYAHDLPVVAGDRVQLQQVVLNLKMNGIEAMAAVADGPRELAIGTARDGEGVQVSVRDLGTGVAPEAMSRMFDAFYTTKPGGLGMGLSISRSIVEPTAAGCGQRPTTDLARPSTSPSDRAPTPMSP